MLLGAIIGLITATIERRLHAREFLSFQLPIYTYEYVARIGIGELYNADFFR